MAEMPSVDRSAEPQGSRIEIISKGWSWKEVDGVGGFNGVHLVFKSGEEVYVAFFLSPYDEVLPSEFNDPLLSNKVLIPTAAYQPPFSPTWTRAPDPLPSNTYIKTPSLGKYDPIDPNAMADTVLREVRMYELLKENPHPNIARYFGCQVTDGKISGICLAKYEKTLFGAFNPRFGPKRGSSARLGDLGDLSRGLQGVEAGLAHLHSLGFVHNDITPTNIMIDGDDWVIIDFDFCRKIGESLAGLGGTYEWYDEARTHSRPENDLNALHEIRLWLSGAPADAFQYPEVAPWD